MKTILSTSQIETRLGDIHSTAQVCKQTSAELNERLTAFMVELCERTPGGKRRYSVEQIGYARGYCQALYHRIMREQVEFVYRDQRDGVIYGTHKDSTFRSTEPFYQAGRGSEFGEMECAHVWKGTYKPFTPWSVPNQDMRDRAAVKAAKADSRYTVTQEGTGSINGPQWVVRFCGEWVDIRATETEAYKLAAEHHTERQALLKGE
jgi:hypothetical protein